MEIWLPFDSEDDRGLEAGNRIIVGPCSLVLLRHEL